MTAVLLRTLFYVNVTSAVIDRNPSSFHKFLINEFKYEFI